MNGDTSVRYAPELLYGVVVLEHPGSTRPAKTVGLYNGAAAETEKEQAAMLTLIPSYARSSRDRPAMQVWIPYKQV